MQSGVESVRRASSLSIVLALVLVSVWALTPKVLADSKGSSSSGSCTYKVEYYSNGKVKSSVGYAQKDGKSVLSCKTTAYFDTGVLALEQEFKNGLPHGAYRTYFETGKLEMELSYEEGLPDGKMTYYYPTGVLRSQGDVVDGLRTGLWTTWYDTGKVESQGSYDQDKKVGVWTFQRADGSEVVTVDYSSSDAHAD